MRRWRAGRVTKMAPRQDDIQATVISIWKELLEVTEVSPDDDFLQLDGSSMIALRMLNRINEQFQIDLSAQVLFECATVRELAAAIVAELKS